MKYKMVMVQKFKETEKELNSLSKKGYRLLLGPVPTTGGKSFLVMEKRDPGEDYRQVVVEDVPEDPPVEKTSEDSTEVK